MGTNGDGSDPMAGRGAPASTEVERPTTGSWDVGLVQMMPDCTTISTRNYRTIRRQLPILAKACVLRDKEVTTEAALKLLSTLEASHFDLFEDIELEEFASENAVDIFITKVDQFYMFDPGTQMTDSFDN